MSGPAASALHQTALRLQRAQPKLSSWGRGRTFCAAEADPAPTPPPASALVVTAGWLGAPKRPFEKYTELWTGLGFSNVLSVRPPLASIVVPQYGDAVARRFAERLVAAAQQDKHAPLLLHLFSGGGYIFVGWLLQQLASRGDPGAADALRRVAGIVLDSSPAAVNADISARAILSAVLRQPAEGIQQRLPWLVGPATAAIDAYLQLPVVQERLTQVHEIWGTIAPTCPQLYLYSSADVITSPAVVEAFMQKQEARGVRVSRCKWEDSQHVAHYRTHPDEYAHQLRSFAAAALAPAAATPPAADAAQAKLPLT